ncbi:MAG: hypothetical protein VX964_02825, partial [Verrucomicrobiota bacterium]|nr:hypothetical protein [Verrucomicrobiota bacterium]
MKFSFYPLLSSAAALFYTVTVYADTIAPVIIIAGNSTVTVEAVKAPRVIDYDSPNTVQTFDPDTGEIGFSSVEYLNLADDDSGV